MKKHLALALCLFIASFATSAAAETWPTRPVKMIVAFAPGGPTDIFARLIGQKLSEATGQNFYVENMRGAGGNIGTGRAAASPPDGYTVLVTGVHPSVPAQSVKELVNLIRATPGKFSYASPGTGTPPQLVGALFQHELKLDLVHVP